MMHWWDDTDRGQPKFSKNKSVPVPLCPPKIPDGNENYFN
jgi:hypothetical protein